VDLLPEVARRGKEEAENGMVSFTDMIWIPLVLNLPIRKHKLIAVDECQDLNRSQHLLLQRAMSDGGNLVGVGDPRQAIYAFAGAMCDSFDQLQGHFEANVKPLSICYRCPTTVIEMARTLVPEIEAAPGAPVGDVGEIEENQFEEMLVPGDMVLCRLNAPLLKLCFQLISRKVHARVRGRDIGAQLAALAWSIGKDLMDWNVFPQAVMSWRNSQIQVLSAKKDAEFAIQSTKDKAECLLTCFASFQPTTCESLAASIQSLFSDEHSPVILSTIHKAKGLENPRVFIIRPDRLPLVWAKQTPEQFQQELNLKYVAITRAQSELYFVKEGRHDELF
jgi:ATP-dependent exoDNAse (exonuclease V) beta subunit